MHQLWLFPPPIPLIHLHLLWNFVQNKLTFPCSCLGELRHSLTEEGRVIMLKKELANSSFLFYVRIVFFILKCWLDPGQVRQIRRQTWKEPQSANPWPFSFFFPLDRFIDELNLYTKENPHLMKWPHASVTLHQILTELNRSSCDSSF